MSIELSFVVPCYNEEGNVEAFYQAVVEALRDRNITYELVMINDGSKDGTRKKLKELYHQHPETNITVINFSRNFGKEAAILAGMRRSRGQFVCLIDADLQQQPSIALEMYDILKGDDDLDCVAAYQAQRHEGKLLTFYKNMFYKLINKMCDIDFVSGASDFRICRRNMIDAILSMPEYYRFSKGIFSWVGFDTRFIPYEAQERNSGESTWSFWKLFRYAMEGILGYTTMPLRLATVLGVLVSFFAVIYFIIVLIQTAVTGISVPGYATTVGLILLLGGLQLLMLGIIGEYLAKTYIQGKNRPVYIEKEVLSREEKLQEKTEKSLDNDREL